MRNLRVLFVSAVTAVSSGQPATAAGDPAAADARLERLEQTVRVLERKLELAHEDAAKRKLETAVIKADSKGFSINSADQAFQLKLRGYVQSDARFVTDEADGGFDDTFTLRRVRPVFEGTLFQHYGFRIMPDFGGGKTVLQDAYVDANHLAATRIRAGKFKSPVGLERLQSGTDIRFVERGLPTNLVPNRDLGVQLHGELLGGIANYAVGIFNGVGDGDSTDGGIGDDKEFAGRLFVSPFRNNFGMLQNLGLGIAGSWGEAAGTDLGRYRSQAQQIFFAYRTDTVADGERWRVAPQAYWYWRTLGLLGEFVHASQEVAAAGSRARLGHDAWQVQGSWVLTGEENAFKSVTPSAPFDPWKGSWGAWELVWRYGELDVDDDAFPLFANPAAAASRARAWGVGLNWYLNANLRLAVNLDRSVFSGGAAGGDRPDEEAVFARFQLVY